MQTSSYKAPRYVFSPASFYFLSYAKTSSHRNLLCNTHSLTITPTEINSARNEYLSVTGKGKGKVHPRTGHEDPEGE
jgi:nitroimidazol reductase NimA-like FMN-containing flavoprotein (pyridoxamine 5'-phosphate oxidase superfamily)